MYLSSLGNAINQGNELFTIRRVQAKTCKVVGMFDITSLAEFSRSNCVAICTFLVPANIVATGLVLISLFLHRPYSQLLPLSITASVVASLLFVHVGTWFMIGVVMLPTFILLGLGTTCLVVNFKFLTDRKGLQNLIDSLSMFIKSRFASQEPDLKSQ